MNVTRSLLEDIKTEQLHWYGHVQRTEEGRLPKEVTKWRPPGRRKRGRPKLTWAEGINLLKPNDIYICRTAQLTSRRYILNIYSTNIRTEYFKHAA